MATAIPANRASFSLAEVARATNGQLFGEPQTACIGVTTDSRAELSGQLFVALKGSSFDGHDFLSAAMARGARGVLSERPLPPGVQGVVVKDTLMALGALAADHRRRWGGTVVAVAGSAGKTTTKSTISALLRALLGEHVHLAAGNLNNQIGVPMVLLGLEQGHEAAVIEIGTNRTGEVPALVAMSGPDIAVLTLIDLEHTEGLGGLEAIAVEEGAIFGGPLRLAVGNADDVLVQAQLEKSRAPSKLSYGFAPNASYRVDQARVTPTCTMDVRVVRPDSSVLEFTTPWLGDPGALASVAAVAAAEAYAGRSLSREFIEAAFTQPGVRESGRLLPINLADGTLVIDDTYNANPASVRAALAVARQVAELRSVRLHLVLGEMRELGSWSASEHQRLVSDIALARPASVTAIAGDAQLWARADEIVAERAFFADSRGAALSVPGLVTPGDVVLVKASRGVRAELVVEALVSARGPVP
jgi:UDP-N-acetylmuramoyl-tripeptide--D-alanyl-D-alanine ligase